jgi:hypothetical protein
MALSNCDTAKRHQTAIRSFARTWTTGLKDRRIRVNAVSPGTIDTPGLSDLLASGEAGDERKKMISKNVPLGRFGTVDEIAKAVVFLASDESSYRYGNRIVCGWWFRTGVGGTIAYLSDNFRWVLSPKLEGGRREDSRVSELAIPSGYDLAPNAPEGPAANVRRLYTQFRWTCARGRIWRPSLCT